MKRRLIKFIVIVTQFEMSISEALLKLGQNGVRKSMENVMEILL